MLTYFRRRYKNFILSTRYYYSVITQSLKTPFAFGVMGFFLITMGVSFYGLDILVSLVYDEEIAEIVDFRILYLLPMFLVATVYLNLVVMVKIVWDRIQRSPGTLLRFRIIGFFFLSILLPAILFIFVFNIFFDRSIDIFDDQAILRTMENKKWTLNQEVLLLMNKASEEFDFQLNTGFSNFYYSRLAYVGVYKLDGQKIYHYKKNNFSLQNVPSYAFNTYLSSTEDRFISYDRESGFVYQLLREPYQGRIQQFAVISKVSESLKKDIDETFLVIRQVKQFELLLYPFKIFTIVFLIYVYLQVFSILAIVFYYSSNRYISPIAELIKATQQIIRGNYKFSLHRFIKHMGNNEIRDLLKSFSKMTQEIFNSRRRLERISNIEAWKEVSQKLAHEIKNPLTPILLSKGQIEQYLIKNDFKGYHQMRENFLFIESEINRILTLLNEFNILTQQKLIHLKWVESEDLLNRLERLVSNYPIIRWVKDNRIKGSLYIDKDKIIQVLLNLVHNSIESVEELHNQGVVRDFIIKVVTYISEVKNSLTSENQVINLKSWVIEVWDNGLGIPEEKRDEIFKPYVTSKNEGTGLGLTICDEIVSLHQGEIEIFSLSQKEDFVMTQVEEEADLAQESLVEESDQKKNKDYWTVFRITLPFEKMEFW